MAGQAGFILAWGFERTRVSLHIPCRMGGESAPSSLAQDLNHLSSSWTKRRVWNTHKHRSSTVVWLKTETVGVVVVIERLGKEKVFFTMANDSLFILYAPERGLPPKNVTHVRVDSSVTELPQGIFETMVELVQVELPDGLRVIGKGVFKDCRKLENVNVPLSVKTIGDQAFSNCFRLQLPKLPDALDTIGHQAFHACNYITKARIPPCLTNINNSFFWCRNLISLEMPETVQSIDKTALFRCYDLRNIAIHVTTEIGDDSLQHCHDLYEVFPGTSDLIYALKHRFDDLPVHEICYYQSYYPIDTTIWNLRSEAPSSHGERESVCQDCFGMTPLHILALSTKQNMKLFEVLLQQSPKAILVTKDLWGELPIYYACKVDASTEVIIFLFEAIKTEFPDEELDWNKIVDHTRWSRLKKTRLVLDIHKSFFPDQTINWTKLLSITDARGYHYHSPEFFKCIYRYSVAERLDSLGSEEMRLDCLDAIEATWEQHCSMSPREHMVDILNSNITRFEMKEALTLLELAVWKAKIMEATTALHNSIGEESSPKRFKRDESDFRRICQVQCGVSVIISYVIPYLSAFIRPSTEKKQSTKDTSKRRYVWWSTMRSWRLNSRLRNFPLLCIVTAGHRRCIWSVFNVVTDPVLVHHVEYYWASKLLVSVRKVICLLESMPTRHAGPSTIQLLLISSLHMTCAMAYFPLNSIVKLNEIQATRGKGASQWHFLHALMFLVIVSAWFSSEELAQSALESESKPIGSRNCLPTAATEVFSCSFSWDTFLVTCGSSCCCCGVRCQHVAMQGVGRSEVEIKPDLKTSSNLLEHWWVGTCPGVITCHFPLCSVITYTTSRLRVNYLCIFLLNTVDKFVFYVYVFLVYGCLQKHCLRLICLSSITHTYPINISDMNSIGPSYRANQLGSVSISSSQILTLLVSRARYPVREFHDVTRVARDWISQQDPMH